MHSNVNTHAPVGVGADDMNISLSSTQFAVRLGARWKTVVASAIAAGVIGFGISSLIPPTFTARASILVAQQQQSSSLSALSALGSLSSLAGGAMVKTPNDQYVTLMQSVVVQDRLVERFKLMNVYESKFRGDAQRELGENSRILANKKDNLITIEVDDHDPQRAAALANAYTEELSRLSSTLTLSEAKQRRVFFESQLAQTAKELATAQGRLQSTGFNPGAIKTEPKAAAEAYARVKAELLSAEIRLRAMQDRLAAGAPELRQQQSIVGSLRTEIATLERSTASGGKEDYVAAYREFKYQEALFEVFSRQFEMAKLDEVRDTPSFQVIDQATTPERKSKPKRLTIAVAAMLAGAIVSALLVLFGAGLPRRRRS